MADSDAKILEELKKLNKTAAESKSSLGIAGVDVSASSLLSKTFSLAGSAATGLTEGFEKVRAAIEPNLDTFRELSKSGNNFSNDVVGMTVAMKRTGLSMGDFTELISKNGMNMAGLGGSVARGSEAFIKLSEDLRKSDAAEFMRQAGMSNKELNDVLAIQIGFMRTSMRDNKQRDAEAVASAGRLATEMDAMAKLTGKTREEQADAMKKAQADMQVEAKLRLIGAKEGPEAEAKARAAFAEQYNQAQLRGQGQMFKEVFATGTVTSQEARMQTALLGKEAQATTSQALATAKGNVEEARKFNEQAQVESIKNQRNTALLTIGTMGEAGGAASKSFMDTMQAQRTYRDSIEAIRKSDAFKDKSEAEIIAEANRRVKDSQAGRDAEGKDVSGATKAIISLGARADDVTAALYKKVVTPLNEQIGPQLSTFASRYLGPTTRTGKNYQEAIERAAGEEGTAGKPKTREELARRPAQEFAGEGLVRDASEAVRKVGSVVETGIQKINELSDTGGRNPNARSAPQGATTPQDPVTSGEAPTNKPRTREDLGRRTRDFGTLGMTGSMFESEDFYGKVAKGETVMTSKQLESLIQGSTASGIMSGIQSKSQKTSTPLDAKQLFAGAFNSAPSSSGSKEMQQMLSIMDQQKKAMDVQSRMDTLNTGSFENKFKKIGSTEGAEAEAKARAKFNEQTAQSQAAKDDKAKTIQVKDASLNDVVASLNKLNIKIAQLNDNLVDVGSKQIRAVKSNSKNLYERA